jgi:hypothetical protein
MSNDHNRQHNHNNIHFMFLFSLEFNYINIFMGRVNELDIIYLLVLNLIIIFHSKYCCDTDLKFIFSVGK